MSISFHKRKKNTVLLYILTSYLSLSIMFHEYFFIVQKILKIYRSLLHCNSGVL